MADHEIIPATTPRKVCAPHDWETGGAWGVIVGVSKCRRCGKVSANEDFPALSGGYSNG